MSDQTLPRVGAPAVTGGMSRHHALIILTIAFTSSHVDRGVVNILLPAIKAAFRASDTLLGPMGGFVFALFCATLGMPVAMWADRGNRRNIIANAVTIWSACRSSSSSTCLPASISWCRSMSCPPFWAPSISDRASP